MCLATLSHLYLVFYMQESATNYELLIVHGQKSFDSLCESQNFKPFTLTDSIYLPYLIFPSFCCQM